MPLFGRTSAGDEQRAEAYRDWVARTNPLAIASLVLGVFSLIEFGALLVFGVAGIVLGVIALRQIKANHDPARPGGVRIAWAGIVLSVLSLVVAAWLYALQPARGTTTQPHAVPDSTSAGVPA